MATLYTRNGQPFLVDDDKEEMVTAAGPWHQNCGYIAHKLAGKNERLHRFLLGLGPSTRGGDRFVVDHITGDRSDNRMSNLRLVTYAQNSQNAGMRSDNTSGHKGVYRSAGRWTAQIQANGARHWLGRFDSVAQASEAYAAAVIRFHGEFGRIGAAS